jgi:hypothetical protein
MPPLGSHETPEERTFKDPQSILSFLQIRLTQSVDVIRLIRELIASPSHGFIENPWPPLGESCRRVCHAIRTASGRKGWPNYWG